MNCMVYHYGYVTVLLEYFMSTLCLCHNSVYLCRALIGIKVWNNVYLKHMFTHYDKW